MKKTYVHLIFISCVLFNTFSSSAQCGPNLLTNPSFETPVYPFIGNNLTGLFGISGWAVTGNYFNIVKPMGTNYPSGPNNAKEGLQYADITSAGGTIYQDFTVTGTPQSSPFGFGGYFSSRESSINYVNWTASIQILKLPSNNVVSTSTIRAFTNADGANPQQEIWYFIYGFASLKNGNYRFLVNIGDYGNFDAAFVTSDCILPLQLNSFSGEYIDNAVKLSWKKDYQSGFSHFEVEKSDDGNTFTSIARLRAANTSSYSFTDPDIVTNSGYYYRLKMVETNGHVAYSAIIRVNTKNMFSIQVSPNPASDYLTISGMRRRGWIRIHDTAGSIVIRKQIQSNALSIDISFLQKGIYWLEYFDGYQTQVSKIMRQ